MGLVDYGSDSGSESDTQETLAPKPTPVTKQAAPKQPAKRPPKKIGIALPALSAKRADDDDEARKSEEPPAKRAKTGAGKSALLSMLPTPKTNKPITQPAQRVLGGGAKPGLVFTSTASDRPESFDQEGASTAVVEDEDAKPAPSKPSLLPPSLQKRGRANVSLEETLSVSFRKPAAPAPSSAPAVDFFGLGAAKSALPSLPSSSGPSRPSLSSAPALPEFTPPEPTPYDAYPGYYQLPSGAWAMHDAEYYAKFTKKWQAEYAAHVRALEKGTVKGFEGAEDAPMQEVDPIKEMEKAKIEVKEREDRKALTMGASGPPPEPKMKMTAAKMSGVARSRHQLATLLKDAYENREMLEERIAQGRRNRKEAGNKYGF